MRFQIQRGLGIRSAEHRHSPDVYPNLFLKPAELQCDFNRDDFPWPYGKFQSAILKRL